MKQRTMMKAAANDGGDVNQKKRRKRGGRIRLLWQTWAAKNPTLATLLLAFVCLCLVCMTFEHMHNSSTHGHFGRHSIRRAKALLQQATARHGRHGDFIDKQEGTDDGDDEGDDEESGEGDDRRQQRKRDAPGRQFGRNDKKRSANKKGGHPKRYRMSEVEDLVQKLDQDVVNNADGGIRWTAPYLLLPPLVTNGRQLSQTNNDDEEMTRGKHKQDAVNPKQVDTKSEFFKTKRKHQSGMKWEKEYAQLREEDMKPPVDYATHAYEYPDLPKELPNVNAKDDGSYPDYPPLRPLGDMMKDWPQDNDFPGAHERPIPEALVRFNYSNPAELEMARQFRDAELPFKLYDVPEVTAATQKWTDSYVAENFDGAGFFRRRKHGGGDSSALMDRLLGVKPKLGHEEKNEYTSPPPRANGQCQESPNNFFAFFQPNLWDVKTMGLPPVRNNDWTYEHWSEHARYADAVGLNASKPHFYWQSGVPREERLQSKSEWTFISRDLPSFSSPTETFFVFSPESQKGIQCRFGERGVVAATHYDSGRNMIAMVTGAKRYILAPPKECPNLGVVPWKFNAIFRHSLLNFGHINYMNDTSAELDDGEQAAEDKQGLRQKWKGDHMSQVERQWMDIASSSKAVETVLKAGEVLYLPSHWFHYIVSLQKSAQCNVRSGVHDKGSPGFGGLVDVKTCGRLTPEEAGIRA